MAGINIDGIAVDLHSLLDSLKLQGGTRNKLKEDQQARSKKFGIQIQPGSPLAMPARFVRLGAKMEDLADRVNFKFPVWLTKPDRDALTPAQLAQVRNAKARFEQNKDRYDQMSRAAVERRIDEARKKFEVGQDSQDRMEKAWDCVVFKADQERQLIYSVVLKASGGDNGIRPDTQRDILSSQVVEETAHRFMLESRTFDLHHKETLPQSRVAVVESYLSPVNFQAGKTEVKKGDWIVVAKVHDEGLWKLIKAGQISAFSIKGIGRRSPLKNTNKV